MGGQRRSGILYQIYVIALIGLTAIGLLTYVSQHEIAKEAVIDQTEKYMDEVTDDTIASIEEYPAYEWLLSYWYENAEDMDVEYDVDFNTGTRTREKVRVLEEHQPDLQLRYAEEAEIRALPPEDQKLYAEIVYSWMTTRINEIKRSYEIDFLFCCITDMQGQGAYKNQFFLLSGSDPGEERGIEYEQVYPLGKEVSVAENKSQQDAMREAVKNANTDQTQSFMADAGNYMDYYSYLGTIGDKAILIGLTQDLSAMMKDVSDQTINGSVYAVFYQVILLIILMLLMYFTVIRPLKHVQENIRLYAKEKNGRVAVKGLTKILSGIRGGFPRNNEIGILSQDVTGLVMEIDDYIERIEVISADRQRIETELELASRIQRNVLTTSFPSEPEFDLYATMIPAKEVGGDFYDFYMHDDDHLVLVIADVSGKGIPAALFMMSTMNIVRNAAIREISPAKILEVVNDELCVNNQEEMFVTVWVGVLEISSGILTAANAGHEYPVYKDAGDQFRLMRDKHGFLLGSFEGMKHTDYEVQMKPGSKLFVYTDGLPEATDSNQELYGTERMLEALCEVQDESPHRILNHTYQAVQEFIGDAEQFDDLTMLCIEYHGPDAE